MTDELTDKTQFEFKTLNWGALSLTPLWLFLNGFWLTAVIYVFTIFIFWPLSLAISLLFFIKGNEWSWKNGSRWESFEKYSDSQYAWNFIGKIIVFTLVIILIMLGAQYFNLFRI